MRDTPGPSGEEPVVSQKGWDWAPLMLKIVAARVCQKGKRDQGRKRLPERKLASHSDLKRDREVRVKTETVLFHGVMVSYALVVLSERNQKFKGRGNTNGRGREKGLASENASKNTLLLPVRIERYEVPDQR